MLVKIIMSMSAGIFQKVTVNHPMLAVIFAIVFFSDATADGSGFNQQIIRLMEIEIMGALPVTCDKRDIINTSSLLRINFG